MLIAVFTACTAQEPESFDVDFTVNNDGTDLEGVTVKYMRHSGGIQFTDKEQEILGYEAGTVLGDLAKARINDVEKKLNCNLDITYFDGNSSAAYDAFNMSAVTGEYYCDIFCGISDRFRNAMKMGSLVGLSELGDFLDYHNEEKWGSRDVLEILYWEDDVYGLIPALWPTASVSYAGLVIANEDLITEVNAADPRDLYENKQWTWDTFRDCLEQYYVQEGSEVKHYALSVSKWNMGALYLLSNGYRLAEKGPSGDYQSGLRDPRALKAMNEAVDVSSGSLAHTIAFSDENMAGVYDLIDGKTVLGVMHYAEYVVEYIVKKMTNFGCIPWPSGPDVDPGFKATHLSNIERVLVISRFSKNLDATAIVLNALYEPFEEYPNADAVKDFLYQTYFFDRRDADVYYDLFNTSQYTYFSSAAWNTLGEWLKGGISPAEYIDGHLDKAEAYIEEEIAPSKRGVEAVWGED